MVLATRINSREEYAAVQARIDELWCALPGTPEGDEFLSLASMAHEYGRREFPLGPTDGVDALEFELDRGKATLDEVLLVFGSEDAFAAYMLRERDVSEAQAQQLADLLDLPLEDFTCPFREDAEPGEVMIGGTPWRERLAAMRDRVAARQRIHTATN